MTHSFDKKMMKMVKKNIVFQILGEEDDKSKYMKQAFYLKESKINKYRRKEEEEELNEGEILISEDKQSEIQEDIPKRGKRYIEEYKKGRKSRFGKEDDDNLSIKMKEYKLSIPKKLFDNIQMDFLLKILIL